MNRTIEQEANRQVRFASQLVEEIDETSDPSNDKVLSILTWLNDAGLRLAPAKDERVGLAVRWMTDDEAEPAKEPRTVLESMHAFLEAIKAAGEKVFPGGGAMIIDIMKVPCEDPDCEKCKAFTDLANALEVDAVTEAVSHGHTLDHDCPVCAARDNAQ